MKTITDSVNKKTMKVIRKNDTFIRLNNRKRDDIKTKYQFKDLDGKEYNIYINYKHTKCYFIRTTSLGNQCRVMLPDDVAKQILAETEQVKPNVIPQ